MSSSDSSYSPGDNLVSILWGCELSSAQSSFTFQVPEDCSYDQQLVLCSCLREGDPSTPPQKTSLGEELLDLAWVPISHFPPDSQICVDAAARDEFHVVQVTSGDSRNRSPVTLATLKPSVQPTVALYGMELNPPVTFHLRAGSGPVCISGQHVSLVQSSDEDDDDEEEEEEEELEEPPKRSGAQNGGAAKKWKLEQGNAGVGDPPRPRPRTQNSRIPPSLRSRSSRSPKAPLASRGRGAGRGRKAAAKQ